MISTGEQISLLSLVCKHNSSHLYSFCVGILFNSYAKLRNITITKRGSLMKLAPLTRTCIRAIQLIHCKNTFVTHNLQKAPLQIRKSWCNRPSYLTAADPRKIISKKHALIKSGNADFQMDASNVNQPWQDSLRREDQHKTWALFAYRRL